MLIEVLWIFVKYFEEFWIELERRSFFDFHGEQMTLNFVLGYYKIGF